MVPPKSPSADNQQVAPANRRTVEGTGLEEDSAKNEKITIFGKKNTKNLQEIKKYPTFAPHLRVNAAVSQPERKFG